MNNTDLISYDPNRFGGQAYIKGTEIAVGNVLDLLASGMEVKKILKEHPQLTDTQIRACLAHAAHKEKRELNSFYNFAYHTDVKLGTLPRPHELRDGSAFAEISSMLFARGYNYRGLLLNLTAIFKVTESSINKLIKSGIEKEIIEILEGKIGKEIIGQRNLLQKIEDWIDATSSLTLTVRLDLIKKVKSKYNAPLFEHLSYPSYFASPEEHKNLASLNAEDLIVLTTRPPIHDEINHDNKSIPRSHTPLENWIFESINPYFLTCARSKIELSEPLSQKLELKGLNYAKRSRIHFKQNVDAAYIEWGRYGRPMELVDPHSKKTAVFLIRTPKHEEKPQILVSFGMNGTSGLIWATAIRERFLNTIDLEKPCFIMAEITTRDFPKRPMKLGFADTWEIEILLNEPLPLL